MARNYEEEDLDPEEQSWLAAKQKAAARRAQAQSMAGMPALTEKEYDEQRRQQALRDQAAIRASQITPGSISGETDPFNIDTNVSIPGAAVDHIAPIPSPVAATAAPTANMATTNEATFWTCRVDEDAILYAHTWEDLKSRLVKHSGLWTATEHKFPNTPSNILGFFVPKQHVFPANTTVKQFEIIVKDGKVYKAEG